MKGKFMKDNLFIIMWDMTGLECIIPVDSERLDDEQHLRLIAKLEDEKYDENKSYDHEMGRTLKMLCMRAQVNSQRNYEIYSLSTTQDIDEHDLRGYFEDSPQLIVNLIREKGKHIYGSGAGKNTMVIV